MHAPQPLSVPALLPRLYVPSLHLVGRRCSLRWNVFGQCPAPCGSAQWPSRRTKHLLETCQHHCTRTVPCSLHTCAYRNCATHLAEWCPPCYYVAGPLSSSVEPRGACVTVRDLWTLRPGTRHSVRSATAITRPSRYCDFVTNRL